MTVAIIYETSAADRNEDIKTVEVRSSASSVAVGASASDNST